FLITTNIQVDFVNRLVDRLIIDMLYKKIPLAGRALRLMGIIQLEDLPEDPLKFQPAFTLKSLHWDRIPKLLSEPKQVFEEVYDWGSHDFKLEPLLEALLGFSIALNMPGSYDFPSPGLIKSLSPGANMDTVGIGHSFEMHILEGELVNLNLGITS